MPDMNLELLQPVLEKYAATGRTSLLPSLRAAQEIYGYIPEFAAEAIAKNLQVPLADLKRSFTSAATRSAPWQDPKGISS
jgi:NADH:ubiquinone oxidoreductase subunit E